MFNTSYDLSIPSGAPVTRVFLSQCDNGLASFTLRLYANNRPQTVEEGITAVIVGMKPSGKIFTYPAEITQDRTAVKVTTTAQMTAEKGLTTAQIVFTDPEGKTAGTCNFQLSVEADPTAAGVVSESDLIVFYQAIEAAAQAETAATAAEAARAAIEADAPEVVAITIPETKLWSAITAAQAAAGRSAAVNLTGATYDPEDAARIRAAYIAGKRVRFDLVMTVGTRRSIIASTENMHTATGARNYYTFRAAFDFAALGAVSSIDGLKTLTILYVYDGDTNPATYSVSATAYAAGGYYDAENQLYVL